MPGQSRFTDEVPEEKVITVEKLIALLQAIPDKDKKLPVIVEGCDCVDDLGGVMVKDNCEVYLLRADDLWNGEPHELVQLPEKTPLTRDEANELQNLQALIELIGVSEFSEEDWKRYIFLLQKDR